ncbi:DNA cytosine methyltransferase [Variovorax sp. CCNWLW235]|uniref:DNA cytosine methyltransferase n=1 Tax=Variovorax sp. CCNWLW235 TaxID=3127463 RepID=UPI0030779B64
MMQYKFIDLFSGCGGLSLGFSMAGLEGQFAVEKDAMAFDTFSENFLGSRKIPVAKFSWPSWLKQRAWAIDELLAEHRDQLLELQGTVQVLAGGPPCQGFSFAGKRKEADPRNMLFEKYVQVVDAVKPSALVLENVPGMKVAHKNKPSEGEEPEQASESYYEKLKRSLEAIGYDVHGQIVDASRFGVPQKRSRLIVIGLRRHLSVELKGGIGRAFEILEATRVLQLEELGLLEVTTAMDAISDLRTSRSIRRPCIDQYSPPGFEEAEYLGPGTVFQKLMHKNCRNDSMDSMRLAKHRADVQERFQKILDECPRGVRMNETHRKKYGLKKHRIFPMSPWDPAPTITTLPDDVLHYAEPRILTVRESARLQSFPDWFRFRGKFTTGGKMRTKECPRYTQVGNAVPPLLARAIGLAIAATLLEAADASKKRLAETQDQLDATAAIA